LLPADPRRKGIASRRLLLSIYHSLFLFPTFQLLFLCPGGGGNFLQ